MKHILLPLILIFGLLHTTGCPSSGTTPITPIVNGAISCEKGEAAAVVQGVSVTSAVLGVFETLALSQASGLSLTNAIDALIARYGAPAKDAVTAVVACAVNGLAPQPAVAGSNGATLSPPTPQQQAAAKVIAEHGWKFVK